MEIWLLSMCLVLLVSCKRKDDGTEKKVAEIQPHKTTKIEYQNY